MVDEERKSFQTLLTSPLIIKPPLAIAKAALRVEAVHLFVSLSVCRQIGIHKARFSQKASSLELRSL